MSKYIRLFTILAFASGSSFAQEVPGYLGQKFIFSYEAAFWPTAANPTGPDYEIESFYEGVESTDFDLGLSIKHHLRADYVYSKSLTYGARLGYFSSYYGNTIRPENASSELFLNFGNDLPPRLKEFGEITDISLGFSVKKFSKHFAPLGKFFEFGLELHLISFGNLVFQYDETTDPNNNTLQTFERNVDGGSTVNLSVFLGQGVNRVISDKYVLGFGYELGFALFGYENANTLFIPNDIIESEPINIDENDSVIQEGMANAANGRIFGQALFNLKLSIGILN
jgi:hypothetical protein